jgi:hypothetical protein
LISSCSSSIKYYPTGEVKSKGKLIDGNEHGRWKYFDKNGNLELVIWFRDELEINNPEMIVDNDSISDTEGFEAFTSEEFKFSKEKEMNIWIPAINFNLIRKLKAIDHANSAKNTVYRIIAKERLILERKDLLIKHGLLVPLAVSE